MYQSWNQQSPQQQPDNKDFINQQAFTQQMQGAQMQQQQPMMQQQQPTMQPQGGQFFSAQNYQVPGFVQQQFGGTGMLPLEQSFIENILRLNRGKIGTFYMTFENNSEWNAMIFRGRVEEAGRDHIVISDPDTGMYYLLLMVNLDYVTFDEPIEYEYPFNSGQGAQLAQYSPRPE
ncbi:spore coat protein GerQ [Alkalihalophilus pseudofirmus]|uniref:spore coat protein GerQ n=1 Tax=Alkalihalophilus pseudofirmus TaxID=79885 RepID=UPI000951BF8C|nr:spore coat protein GerQ [Alkalihalophilus pseudofirmus]